MRLTGLTRLAGFFGGPPAGSGGGTPAPAPADLPAAVAAAFKAGALADLFPGGLFLGRAGRRAALPYLVLTEVGSHLSWRTDTSEVHLTRLRLQVCDDDGDRAADLALAVESAFKGSTVAFAGGATSRWTVADRKHPVDGRGYDGLAADLWEPYVDFSTQVRRAL